MIGPSSSHTAGACRLALLARHLRLTPPDNVTFTLHGSFAKTAHGHGTELALIAGMLDLRPDDPRLQDAPELARRAGLDVTFESADLGDVHPNTVRIVSSGGATDVAGEPPERISLTGSSVGGGMVRVFEVDGFGIDFSGGSHTLLVRHDDHPGVIARVARVIADDESNIATLHSARRRRGGEAMMSVEMDKRLSQIALDYLTYLPYVTWVRMMPEVLSGEGVPS